MNFDWSDGTALLGVEKLKRSSNSKNEIKTLATYEHGFQNVAKRDFIK